MEEFNDVLPADWAADAIHSTAKKAANTGFPGEAIVSREGGVYTAYATVEKGKVQFIFSEISFTKQSVECVLSIHLRVSEGYQPPFTQRIDLRSASARKSLATDLNAAYGDKKAGYNWVLLCNTAFNGVVEQIQKDQQPQTMKGLGYEEVPFLASPFLQTGVPNVLFAQSEAGKTWFALRLALSLVTGQEFIGYPIKGGHKVLFLDYEDSMRVFVNRIYNLAVGMGIKKTDVEEAIHYYKPTGSFRNNTEHIKGIVEQHGYSLIIIDAGGDAAGGSPSDEEKVLDLFNALEEVKTTKLILHHEPKYVQNEQAAFFGSMYWKARARVAWRLQVESEEAGKKLIKASIQKRSNLPYIEPFYYHLEFDSFRIFEEYEPEVTMAVRMTKAEAGVLNKERPIGDVAQEAIKEHGELTSAQISELAGRERTFVHRTLLQDKRFIQKKVGKGMVWLLQAE